ncbi:MAG: FAD binding domain-containing protein [Actinomycetota bacterium]|nr:FAD binding domain-containing protein [Actinomycetota bacterium]
MTVAVPTSLDEALAQLAADHSLEPLAGGTDLMVEVNYGHRRPAGVLSLRRVPELKGWHQNDDGSIHLGAGLTYTEMTAEPLAGLLPALAQAARTVGSPQIRNTGTIGGNLATASPAGDTLPVLAVLDATIDVASAAGTRTVGLNELVTGVKRTTLEPGELVTGVTVRPTEGGQDFSKVGTRNAMVISVVTCALAVDRAARQVRCSFGAVSPAPMRCTDAEAWIAERIDWETGRVDDPRSYETFGTMCAEAATPIDDHRSTADYRRHACGVLARRALLRLA